MCVYNIVWLYARSRFAGLFKCGISYIIPHSLSFSLDPDFPGHPIPNRPPNPGGPRPVGVVQPGGGPIPGGPVMPTPHPTGSKSLLVTL